MRRLIRGLRPTPALVIACLSLFVAMGGVGYAALNGKDKKKVRSIADQEISKQARGLSVANADAKLSGTPAAGFQKSCSGGGIKATAVVEHDRRQRHELHERARVQLLPAGKSDDLGADRTSGPGAVLRAIRRQHRGECIRVGCHLDGGSRWVRQLRPRESIADPRGERVPGHRPQRRWEPGRQPDVLAVGVLGARSSTVLRATEPGVQPLPKKGSR